MPNAPAPQVTNDRLLSAIGALLWVQDAVARAGDDLQQIMQAVVDGALRAMPTAQGAVIELREGAEMVYRAASGTASNQLGMRLKVAGSLSGLALRAGEPLICEDSETDPRVDLEACRRIGVRSMVVVPIRSDDGFIGVLKLYSGRPAAFTEVEQLATQLLVGPIAAGLHRIARSDALHAKSRAEASASAKASFLANMSHEIRTPMNGVIGFGDLLLRTELDPTQRRYAGLIVDSATALLTLLNDILDFSKIEAGQLDIAQEAFDLPQTLKQCLRLVAPSAEAKGLVLEAHLDPTLPLRVYGDPFRLRQVLLNLLGNAVKFTSAGTVSIVAQRLAGAEIGIAIEDTGIGIPPARLDAIFEEFTQADPTTARRFGGSGLGLSISRRLAELMDGSLRLSSVEGRGTRAYLRLPLVCLEAAVAQGEEQLASALPASASARPARILVAEDIDINQEVVGAMLSRLGHTHVLAVDGEQAIEAFAAAEASQPFDLVLMDVHMPRVDGIAATRAIRRRGGRGVDTPILALTASAFPDELARCLAAGMNGHLLKPLTQAALDAELARWLPAAEPPPAPALVAEPDLHAMYQARKAEAARVIAELRPGLESAPEDERARLQGLAHGLSGVCGLFGEAALGALAAEVEAAARAPEVDSRALAAAVDALAAALG